MKATQIVDIQVNWCTCKQSYLSSIPYMHTNTPAHVQSPVIPCLLHYSALWVQRWLIVVSPVYCLVFLSTFGITQSTGSFCFMGLERGNYHPTVMSCVCVFQHIGLLQACIHRCTVCTGGEMWAPYLAWWGNELLRQDELYLLGSSLVCTCTCVCEPVCMCFCAPQLKTDHSGAVVHSRHRVCWQHNWLAWHFNSPLLWGDSILWPVSNRSC